jgi:hypothetical protein
MTRHTKLFALLAISLILLAAVIISLLIPRTSRQADISMPQGYNIGYGHWWAHLV